MILQYTRTTNLYDCTTRLVRLAIFFNHPENRRLFHDCWTLFSICTHLSYIMDDNASVFGTFGSSELTFAVISKITWTSRSMLLWNGYVEYNEWCKLILDSFSICSHVTGSYIYDRHWFVASLEVLFVSWSEEGAKQLVKQDVPPRFLPLNLNQNDNATTYTIQRYQMQPIYIFSKQCCIVVCPIRRMCSIGRSLRTCFVFCYHRFSFGTKIILSRFPRIRIITMFLLRIRVSPTIFIATWYLHNCGLFQQLHETGIYHWKFQHVNRLTQNSILRWFPLYFRSIPLAICISSYIHVLCNIIKGCMLLCLYFRTNNLCEK